MLDVVAAAAWQSDEPARLRADLKAQPTVVKANALMRFFGPIRTATYESLAAFMDKNGLLEAAYTLNYQRP